MLLKVNCTNFNLKILFFPKIFSFVHCIKTFENIILFAIFSYFYLYKHIKSVQRSYLVLSLQFLLTGGMRGSLQITEDSRHHCSLSQIQANWGLVKYRSFHNLRQSRINKLALIQNILKIRVVMSRKHTKTAQYIYIQLLKGNLGGVGKLQASQYFQLFASFKIFYIVF